MDDPVFVEANDNILVVIKKLLQLKKGYVLVTKSNDNTVGIISDRDIHRLILKEGGMFSPDLLAKDCMVKPVITIVSNATLQDAEEIMHVNKINRLPVVEKEGSKKVIGVINYETVHSNVLTNFAKKWVKRSHNFNR
ncbi:MAG: CBS domain-containing protein [Asgard group archaeon]|nr:CBS domain-containing protein [Asgard group archaeon]